MRRCLPVRLLPLLLALTACGGTVPADDEPTPEGLNSEVLESPLTAWCDQPNAGEAARHTLNAVLAVIGSADCHEAQMRWEGLAEKSLALDYRGITDVTPLLALRGLSRLSLQGNQIVSLTPLESLRSLVWLDVSGNRQLDVESLRGLQNLETLIANDTGATSVDFAANLVRLRGLSLAGSLITDVTPLQQLPLLSDLNISRSGAGLPSGLALLSPLRILNLVDKNLAGADLSVLPAGISTVFLDRTGLCSFEGLAHLQLAQISFAGNCPGAAVSLAPLASQSGLSSLNLAETKINGAAALSALGSLRDLRLRKTGLTDVNFASPGLHLLWLDLSGNMLESLQGLGRVAGVEILDISANKLTALSGADLPLTLKVLKASENPLMQLTAMDRHQNLSILSLNGCDLENILDFNFPPRLLQLDLSVNRIARTEVLGGQIQMTRLNLSRNRVRNVAPLASLLNLEYLDLSHNQVTALTPLRELTGLEVLDLRGNGLPARTKCPVPSRNVCQF